jgi:hypothetical protein
MMESKSCEYCSRPIKTDPTIKTLKGNKHTFCSEFCFRLYFYEVPTISFDDLQEMYKLRCVTVNAPKFSSLIEEEE